MSTSYATRSTWTLHTGVHRCAQMSLAHVDARDQRINGVASTHVTLVLMLLNNWSTSACASWRWTPRTLGHKAVALHADALDTGVHPQLQWWVACRQASTPAAANINVGLHLWHLRMPMEPIDTRLQKWDSTNIRGSHVNTQCLFEDHHLVISMLIVHTRSTWQRRHSLRLTLLQQL